MKCPYCGYNEDKVVDTRVIKDGTAIRRRRECLKCKRRFTTYEYIENAPLIVIKRDGRREPFEREKLLQGIRIACRKRPVSEDKIEEMVDEIEQVLWELGKNEVSSKDIGKEVMKRLKKIDEVAYVRFASVYREFKDVEEFVKEIEKLKR